MVGVLHFLKRRQYHRMEMNGSSERPRREEFKLTWAGYSLDLDERTHVMGVLNITPDSFSDGGLYYQRDTAIEQGRALAREGADMIDVGGESTRPYSESVSEEEEMARVIPVIETLRRDTTIPISIDTCKAEVARHALRAGASMINDISSLRFDPRMAEVAAEAEVPVILMHMKGTPGNMQDNPAYDDLLSEISDFLRERIAYAVERGIRRDRIIVDPGIGFGKTFDHNLEIIKNLNRLSSLERPILLGSSRKAFLGHLLGREPRDRDTGTMATITAGILNGARIVRVHNLKMALDTVKVADAIKRGCVDIH
jgi:dihydropteroate synthase